MPHGIPLQNVANRLYERRKVGLARTVTRSADVHVGSPASYSFSRSIVSPLLTPWLAQLSMRETNTLACTTEHARALLALAKLAGRVSFLPRVGFLGLLYLFGKLPTYPSPKPTLTRTSLLGQNVGLEKEKGGSFEETYPYVNSPM